MIEAALILLTTVLTVASVAAGNHTLHRVKHQRCLANIERLEIETGIVPAPRDALSAYVSITRAAEKWQRESRNKARNYDTRSKAEVDRAKLNKEWAERVFGK